MYDHPTSALAARLRRQAREDQRIEAAVELLNVHGLWLERPDLLTACGESERGTLDDHALTSLDLQAITTFLDNAPCVASEARVLCLTAESTGAASSHALTDLRSGLETSDRALAPTAVTDSLVLGHHGQSARP